MEKITCEGKDCTEELDHAASHSMWAVLQKVTPEGYTFFQCEEGQDFRWVNYQHFHCSHECMTDNMASCLQNHYTEEKLHPIPVGEGKTILHKMVLGSNLLCKQCQAPLVNQAYRFCLTQGLPFHRVPDDSQDHLGEWCCTLEHARTLTLATIATLEKIGG